MFIVINIELPEMGLYLKFGNDSQFGFASDHLTRV